MSTGTPLRQRALTSFYEREAKADCLQGKHLWLVTQIENTASSTPEVALDEVLFVIKGRCAKCEVRGKSDMLTRRELPVNEKLFEMLHPSKT